MRAASAARCPEAASILANVAVNTRVLFGSFAAAVVISVAGGYALSRSQDSDRSADSQTRPDDDITITSNGVFVEPGLPTNAPVEGTALPAVSLRDAAGNDVSTTDLIGQPLVINVWQTSCEPCKRELPAFATVHGELGDRVRFVGVNSGDTADDARDFAAKYGVDYESFSDPNGEFLVALGITGFPYTLFVAANGEIVAQKGLELSADNIRSTINDTLLS